MEIIHPQNFSKIVYHSVLKGIGEVIGKGIKIAECNTWEFTINLYAFPQEQESVIWGTSLTSDEFESFIITFSRNELIKSIKIHSMIAVFFRNNYAGLDEKRFKQSLHINFETYQNYDVFEASVLPAADQVKYHPETYPATVIKFKFTSENTDNDVIVAEQIIRQHYGENLLTLARNEEKDEFSINVVVVNSRDLEDNAQLHNLFLDCGLKSTLL